MLKYRSCRQRSVCHNIKVRSRDRPFSHDLSLASQASALDLTKSLGSTQESGNADKSEDRQNLEQVPADVVQIENKLHGNDGAEEDAVGNGSSRKRLLEVGDVATKDSPLFNIVSLKCRNADFAVRSMGELTPRNKAGIVARTASAKTKEITLGGLWGSDRKM